MTKLTFAAAFAAASLAATASFGQANLTAETAGAAGVPGTVMLHLGEAASAAGVANIQVQTGQTLTNSVQNVAEGKTDVAAAPQILPFLLSKGRGPYSKLGEDGEALADNLRALYTYNFGYHVLFAYDSAGVQGWEDLKGRKVYNGPPRGAALVMARQAIQFMGGGKDGADYTGVQVNWAQDVKTITDGSAEAVVLPLTFPSRRITAALASGNVTVWPLKKEVFETDQFQKYATTPGIAPFRMPIAEAGFGEGITVVNADDTIRAIATTGADIVNKDMSFEMAKALTKAHLDTLDQLKAKAPWGNTVGLGVTSVPESGLCGLNTLKYHPGAIAAWEEAGYTIPDCAKP